MSARPLQGDMGAFLRLYAFLSQIFRLREYRHREAGIFYKRLLPLLDSAASAGHRPVKRWSLTHHHCKRSRRAMVLQGETPTLDR